MGNAITNRRLRASLVIGGCAAGAFCLYAAFLNGMMTEPGIGGVMFGIALAAVVFISWLILPVADVCGRLGAWGKAWSLRALWVLAFVFVVANAVMFASSHRIESVEGKGLGIERYEAAKADRARAVSELDGMKQSELWAASNSCSTASTKKAKAFCDKVREANASIQAASTIMAAGRPAAKDGGAETLAWMLGADPSKVGRAWPIYLGAIVELIASFCWKFAFSPWAPKARAATLEPVRIEPAVREPTPIDLTAAAKALAANRKARPRLGQALLPRSVADQEASPPPKARQRQRVRT